MAGSAKGVLREWYEANNPYEIAKNKLVHVEIKGLPLPVSSDSYRVEWVETVRSHAGVLLDSHVYEATVTVQINPPTTDAVLLRNPGGVYITALSAGKVVGAQ
jgi:type IV secretion system protein VirB5